MLKRRPASHIRAAEQVSRKLPGAGSSFLETRRTNTHGSQICERLGARVLRATRNRTQQSRQQESWNRKPASVDA